MAAKCRLATSWRKRPMPNECQCMLPMQVNAANLVKELPSNLRFLMSSSSRQSGTPTSGGQSFRCALHCT